MNLVVRENQHTHTFIRNICNMAAAMLLLSGLYKREVKNEGDDDDKELKSAASCSMRVAREKTCVTQTVVLVVIRNSSSTCI